LLFIETFPILLGCLYQDGSLLLAPQVSEADSTRLLVFLLPHEQCDSGADLDPFGVGFSREDAGILTPIGRNLTRLVLAAVQAVDPDAIEYLEVALAHAWEGEPIQPRIVGYKAHDALSGALDNLALRYSIEADI